MKRTPLLRRTRLNPGRPKRGRYGERKAGIRRVKRMKTRKVGKRFAKLRDDDFRAFVAQQPCVLAGNVIHRCEGVVECCHRKSRGAGGGDRGNCFPACSHAHRQQHQVGIKTFAEIWGLNLAAVCDAVALAFEDFR